MPDTSGTTSSQPAMEAFFDFRRWCSGNTDAVQRWINFTTETAKSGNELSSDTLAFLQTSFRTNIDTWQGLASCRAPADLLEWQRSCIDGAATQYLEQTKKFTTWVVDLANRFGAALRAD